MTPERMRQLKKLADRGVEMEIPIASDLRECLAEIAALEHRFNMRQHECTETQRIHNAERNRDSERITELESTVQAQADTLAKLREALMNAPHSQLCGSHIWKPCDCWKAKAEAALEATK